MENKLNIRLSEENARSIIFSLKWKLKDTYKLDIRRGEIVKYLACVSTIIFRVTVWLLRILQWFFKTNSMQYIDQALF